MPALSSAPSSAALRRGGSTSSVAGTRLCAAPRTVVGRHRKLGRVVVAPRAIVSERHQVPFEKDSEHLETWSPDSWRNFEALQQPEYPDEGEVKAVFNEIARKPPLVFAGEARELQDSLGRASRGEAFVVFGGDCAESFKDFNTDGVRDTYRVLLQMSAVLMYGTQTPVVKIGRLAGQFAKPRSADFEQIGDVELPSYRGDIINDMAFTPEARVPDPWRLVQAYNQSSATLNLLRAFSQGGYASLERVTEWNLGFMESAEQGTRFQEVAEAVTKAVGFMKACGMMDSLAMKTTSFFTAHECLLLEYEEALTRLDSTTGLWYDCSAHLLWCGERTRQLDKAHVEFLRGIGNPIGVKVSDKMDPQQLVELIEKLNPKNEPGRLTIISRMSADKLRESLPTLIRVSLLPKVTASWYEAIEGPLLSLRCDRSGTGCTTGRASCNLGVRPYAWEHNKSTGWNEDTHVRCDLGRVGSVL
eukprot:scaffold1318_cov388-Prasinococcus_capsulatus_cf.AAC.56